ncbi:MAG: ATPase, T2SS/T4P/T4SS family [archaeon]|jgi:Flp pilus assembly CpaF family ATPase
MQKSAGFTINQLDYSKKVSECVSGEIVAKQGDLFLVLNIPKLSEKENKFFGKVLEELKHSNTKIEARRDVYFFLKNYCLESLVLLPKEQREKMLQLLEWESLGESVLTPLLKDPDFEEIIVNGPNKEIMVYHSTFGWLRTNVFFDSEEKIKNIVNKMAAPLGRQLSFHTPMVNAVLADGSRLNASIYPVAFSGINVTIRKFKENPLTPINLIDFGTISREAMAFLWLAMQTSSSILICGNTGSGKTTTLNSLFCFLPPKERIIIVEETPELMPPQHHLIKMNTAEKLKIGLDKLIENTFRMRPDRVIVGEIRGKEEAKAFIDTMLAGQARGSYCTFHAESAKEALERLVSFGIEERALASLDLIVVQKRQEKIEKSGARREERKVTEISEVIQKENSLQLKTLYSFSYEKNKLEKKEETVRVLEKIARAFSTNEKETKKLLKQKEKLLKNLDSRTSFREFFEIIERE